MALTEKLFFIFRGFSLIICKWSLINILSQRSFENEEQRTIKWNLWDRKEKLSEICTWKEVKKCRFNYFKVRRVYKEKDYLSLNRAIYITKKKTLEIKDS